MKRTLLALLVGLSLLLSLAACGSGRASAQEVTEQGLAALRDLDVLALPQYWNTDGLNLDDLGDLTQAGEEVDLSAEDTAALAQAMTRHLSWQVISAQEDPGAGTASVTVSLTNLDMAPVVGQFLQEAFGIPKREAVKAIRKAYEAYDAFRDLVRRKGAEYIDWARANGHRILVVAGRPYHMDPEINHGINDLITGFGFVLVTEDAVFQHMDKQPRHVLNQWTYHARMYNAARYVCTQPDMAFLQLVSFGCGVDAITTDELRSILEEGGDLYTQIKIDDISNLGAVRIRIRSLMAALDARDAQAQKGGQ